MVCVSVLLQTLDKASALPVNSLGQFQIFGLLLEQLFVVQAYLGLRLSHHDSGLCLW